MDSYTEMIFDMSMDDKQTSTQKIQFYPSESYQHTKCPIQKLVQRFRVPDKPDFDPSIPQKIIIGFPKSG